MSREPNSRLSRASIDAKANSSPTSVVLVEVNSCCSTLVLSWVQVSCLQIYNWRCRASNVIVCLGVEAVGPLALGARSHTDRLVAITPTADTETFWSSV